MKPTTVAIIPARGGSKGVPRKNVRSLAGKPLLAHSVEQARQANSIGRILVSTDDPEIAAVAKEYGAEVVQRPVEISGDSATSESALLHALEYLRKRDGYNPDLLVFLQCTSPLTLSEDIEGAIHLLLEEDADTVLSVTPFHRFVWGYDGQGNAVGINHDKRFRVFRQDREPEYIENGAIYVMRVEGFLRARHRFFGKTVLYEMPPERSLEIDETLDFVLGETLLHHRLHLERLALLPNSIHALVLDFDGVFTDNRVIVFANGDEAVVAHKGDGLGLARFKRLKIPVLVLSSETNPVVEARCRKLRVEYQTGLQDKQAALQSWLAEKGLDRRFVVYVGNDMNDLECMQWVGCGAAVRDAHPSVLSAAKLVLRASGGAGAIQEVCDLIEQKLRQDNGTHSQSGE
jgi:YrbI family 3-deoxy-D-manno-octulosonate 8-phosphate phosphatase